MDDMNEDEDLIPPDTRRHRSLLDSRRQADGELSDSDDEGTGGRKNHAHHRERDSVSRSSENDSQGGRKFGMGPAGIMGSGSTAIHAGPSGHTTIARILSNSGAPEEAAPSTPEGSSGTTAKSADDMVVDEPSMSAT